MLKEVLLIFVLTVQAKGARFFNPDECPNGHKLGEIWPMEGVCGECECQSDGYMCTTCGKLSGRQGCSVTNEDMSLPYPDCCRILECSNYNGVN
ncbi:hypothetical protein Btru_050084 [Bulinus truncatus]|nr:hypothetical protein Btru_050084 [Bulinus truncatus]